MLIALCTLLAASPVHLSLAPQSSALRLLDESSWISSDVSAQYEEKNVSPGTRIAVEAVVGALLGGGLAAGGALLGSGMPSSGGFISLNLAPVFLGFIGLEIGEIIGIALAGSALGWHGNIGHVILGKVIGIGAMLVLAPVLGFLAAAAGPVVGLGGFCLISLASGIAGPEIFGNNRARALRSETPAALTLRF